MRVYYNVLTLLNAVLCGVISRMSSDCYGTSFSMAAESLLIVSWDQGSGGIDLGRLPPFTYTLTQTNAPQPRVQKIYWPSVGHKNSF